MSNQGDAVLNHVDFEHLIFLLVEKYAVLNSVVLAIFISIYYYHL
jgi:hypothetical protein